MSFYLVSFHGKVSTVSFICSGHKKENVAWETSTLRIFSVFFSLWIFDVFIFHILHVWIFDVFFNHNLNQFNNVFLVLFALNIFILGFQYIYIESSSTSSSSSPLVLISLIMASLHVIYLALQTFKLQIINVFDHLSKNVVLYLKSKGFFPTHILSEKYEEHLKIPTNNNDSSYCCKT